MLLNWLVILPALAAVVAIPWLFLAAVENNDLFHRIDGTFVALATLTELLASVLVFRARRYSSSLPYEQGTFVARCVAPVVLAAGLLCIAVLGMNRWITLGLVHPASDLLMAWIFAGVWCVVNPLLGWSMIERGWFKPKNLQIAPMDEAVQRVRRRYEFWGLLASGLITTALLVGVIVYWLAPLYATPGWYVVLGLPILLGLYLLARTLFVAVASASENPYAAAACGNVNDADREWWARMSGWVLLVAVAWIGITTICLYGPIGLRWLGENVSKFAPAAIGAVGGISGLVTFDAALSQLVVNFMSDAHAGVREMTRVTRPGGVVASCVWDYAGEMTLLRAFWDAAREVDPNRGAAADEGVVMQWCAEGELAELWEAAGLADVRFGSLTARASYADFEDLWAPLPTGVGPAGAFTASLDDERRATLRDAFRRRLGVGDGPFELTARAWAVAGMVEA